MSAKTKRMGTIKQLLQMHGQGFKYKVIARSLKMSKNTVKSYLRKVSESGVDIKDLLELDDPVLEMWFHAGTAAYPDKRFEDFKERLDYLVEELGRRHITKRLLWEEYRSDNPNGYMYSQFCFHLSQHLLARNPSMVLTHQPGEKLFVDFAGDKISYTDRDTGEIIRCQVFVACMPYSDYSFAMAVRHQSIEDFLYALSCCLEALGGVPQVVVPDNLKAAIIKASRYEPDINQALEDFANHYQFTVVPARVSKPLIFKNMMQIELQMNQLRLRGMARSWQAMVETRRAHELTLPEGLGILLQGEVEERANRRFDRLQKNARFRYRASIEELTYDSSRGLDKALIANLATGEYLGKGESVLITGKTGVGKSFLASALGLQACAQGYSVEYFNAQKMFLRLKMARLEGTILKFFDKLAKTKLLVIDDFGLAHLDKQQQLDLLDIMEDRHGRYSTIIASQLPVAAWYDVCGERTIADAVLDRLVHTSYRIEFNDVNLRKKL